jgi:hypothetical protein
MEKCSLIEILSLKMHASELDVVKLKQVLIYLCYSFANIFGCSCKADNNFSFNI